MSAFTKTLEAAMTEIVGKTLVGMHIEDNTMIATLDDGTSVNFIDGCGCCEYTVPAIAEINTQRLGEKVVANTEDSLITESGVALRVVYGDYDYASWIQLD